MFSADAATKARMLTAQAHAADVLGVQVDGEPVWGWRGRTIGARADAATGPEWLRVVSAPAAKAGGKLWDGPAAAAEAMPAVAKPELLAVHDWRDDQEQDAYAYRAELSAYVTDKVCSPTPSPAGELELPDAWWADLRANLDLVAATRTDRVAVRGEYLDRALPQFLGVPDLDTTPPAWTTAHGDLHWANLTSPNLIILDWEGWGLAPLGFDVGMLHAYTLCVPRTAARVRAEFTHVLDTPAGRFAELAAIAMLLQTTTRGDNLDLLPALRHRAAHLLALV